MKILVYVGAILVAYLIASINPAIVMSNLIYKKDIRECGSGNPGFTNFKRVFGNKWAWYVLLLDLLKGIIPVLVFANIFEACGESFQFGAAFTGIFALLGHSFPIWHKFKGGKGFLTYLSVIWIIDIKAGIIAVLVMLILLGITKYMSLSTVIALMSSPVTLILEDADIKVVVIVTACVLYVAIRHKENFVRLIHGEENKFHLK